MAHTVVNSNHKNARIQSVYRHTDTPNTTTLHPTPTLNNIHLHVYMYMNIHCSTKGEEMRQGSRKFKEAGGKEHKGKEGG